MQPRLARRQLRQYPWPQLPLLRAEQLCPYGEPGGRRRTLWECVNAAFPTTPMGREMLDQFLYLFLDVIHLHCDARDQNRITLSDLPSRASGKQTAAPYSAKEVAAWWNEVVQEVNALAGNK